MPWPIHGSQYGAKRAVRVSEPDARWWLWNPVMTRVATQENTSIANSVTHVRLDAPSRTVCMRLLDDGS